MTVWSGIADWFWLTSRGGSGTSPGPPGPPSPKLSVCIRGFWEELRECMGPPGPPMLELPWRAWCCCCCCCCCCCWRGLWEGSMRLEWGIFIQEGKCKEMVSEAGTHCTVIWSDLSCASFEAVWKVAAASDRQEHCAVAHRAVWIALTCNDIRGWQKPRCQ